MQDMTSAFILPSFYWQDFPFCLDFVIFIYFPHDRSNSSFPSFSSTTFQTFQIFLVYFPQCPIFAPYKAMLQTQHFTSFSLKVIANSLVKKALSLLIAAFDMVILDFVARLCTYCFTCYHATQVVEIFHILYLFLIFRNLHCGCLPLRFLIPQFSFLLCTSIL